MKNHRSLFQSALLVTPLVAAVMSGCIQSPEARESTGTADTAAGMTQSPPPKSGIPIPPSVRDNLGITFATVEQRAVATTRRVPGEFELLPTARQAYPALLGGRISLKVDQFQSVQAGDELFTIDSPRWRQIQHEAVEAEGDITMAQAALEVANANAREAQAALTSQEARLQNLAAVNVRKAELEASANALRSSLPRLTAETQAQEAALREAREHYASRLNVLASVTGVPVSALSERSGAEAAWRSIASLSIRAARDGVVETLAVSEGGWLEEGALVLEIIDPAKIRFHAEAPQADVTLFRDGQQASIVPAQGGSVTLQSAIPATLTLGLTANERERTIALYATPEAAAPWAKAGIGGYLEVALEADAPRQWAVPVSAVIQDGLEHVFFRRDPKDPDRALRVLADLGPSDGGSIVLKSGVKEGDEVVLDGVYALKLTSAAQQAPPGYHFHADGALHKNH